MKCGRGDKKVCNNVPQTGDHSSRFRIKVTIVAILVCIVLAHCCEWNVIVDIHRPVEQDQMYALRTPSKDKHGTRYVNWVRCVHTSFCKTFEIF